MHRSALSTVAPRTHAHTESAIRFSRPDPEVPVQVSLRGEWHRPMLDARGIRHHSDPSETACERSLVGQYTARRDESYEGALCPSCFTPAEIRRAADYCALLEQRRVDEVAAIDARNEAWFSKKNGKVPK